MLRSVLFTKLEKPVAYIAFVCAALSLIWESPIGPGVVGNIPVMGPALKAIFDISNSNKEFPQYPRRRSHDEDFWRFVYFAMYGLLGTLAQYGGIQISRRAITRQSMILYCKIYGLFHLLIGCHHLLWSVSRSYGKLELWKFQLPGVYLGTTLSALTLMYHAYQILRVTIRTANLQEICHRKSIMDTATCCTFVSFGLFFIHNIMSSNRSGGVATTSFEMDRICWAITMYLVPFVLILGFVSLKE